VKINWVFTLSHSERDSLATVNVNGGFTVTVTVTVGPRAVTVSLTGRLASFMLAPGPGTQFGS
jgi:hypothetical protein